MNPVTEAFIRLLPHPRGRNNKGAITFNCPFCGDKRGRASLLENVAGGFTYHCWNGGCTYTKGCTFYPENGLFYETRNLFFRLGGSFSDIPAEYLERKPNRQRDPSFDTETATNFPEVRPPPGSEILWNITHPNQDVVDCQNYVLNRAILFREHPFLWCPSYPRYVIFPFEYANRPDGARKPIGWIARAIDNGVKLPHFKCPNFPTDYMLNQDMARQKDICLVQEGTFDAVALQSLCTFGSTLSRKQINFLRQIKAYGNRVVLLPDYQKEEWKPYWQAAKQWGFSMAVPDWPNRSNGIKDAGDSIRYNGVIQTVQAILNGITDNYHEALTALTMFSHEATVEWMNPNGKN